MAWVETRIIRPLRGSATPGKMMPKTPVSRDRLVPPAMPSKTCRVLTLGCKVNQYESQHVLETLEANGYVSVSPRSTPDLIVVNTCTVTHEADAKARQLIRQLSKAHAATPIVVMGCYATREP